MSDKDWFKSWFNTPYYHILYQHRDVEEAHDFIDHILRELNPGKKSKMLDLACGRGRHAIYLKQKGYDVVGIDLSEENIEFARSFEDDHLHFEVNDMRKSLGVERFDYIFNLFTSFGYFDKDEENELAIIQMAKALKKGGMLVLDFMNTHKVAEGLVTDEVKNTDGITFRIKRFTRGQKIIKQISFDVENESHQFEERVTALTLKDFERYLKKADLEIVDLYGDMMLNKFDMDNSDRLILIARRK